MKPIKIGNKKIGPDQPVFVIAEAGVNHDGSLKKALKLVDIAKKSGVDAVKFQTYIPEKLLASKAPKPAYQKKNLPSYLSQAKMLKKLALSQKAFKKIFAYCKKLGILFLSTPYDKQSSEFLDNLGVLAFKLASIEMVNHPFLDYIAKKGRPVLLSTGLSEEGEIEQAVQIFKKAKAEKRLILLHCHTDYPTKDKDANLKRIRTLQEKFSLLVGYSDHTLGILAPLIAVALGAVVIEKHFTWNCQAKGPDHAASLEEKDLTKLVKQIRQVGTLLGNGEIKRTLKEKQNLILRKSIVSSCDIKKGAKITPSMIVAKRPGSGLWPTWENINKIVGRMAKKDVKSNTVLRKEMFS